MQSFEVHSRPVLTCTASAVSLLTYSYDESGLNSAIAFDTLFFADPSECHFRYVRRRVRIRPNRNEATKCDICLKTFPAAFATGFKTCQQRVKSGSSATWVEPLQVRGLITRHLSNSNPARPYICRFSIFRRFTCPPDQESIKKTGAATGSSAGAKITSIL